jgi:hypothetical protein
LKGKASARAKAAGLVSVPPVPVRVIDSRGGVVVGMNATYAIVFDRGHSIYVGFVVVNVVGEIVIGAELHHLTKGRLRHY